MNIFGFFAVLIACATLLGIIWLLVRKPISFRIIRTTEPPKLIEPKPLSPEELKKLTENTNTIPLNKSEIDKDVEITSMDAVIKAANELMGIETVEKENNNGRKE